MKDDHIQRLIDEKPLTALSDTELQSIRTHIANCVDCARAFEAAQLSALLISERVGEAAEDALTPNPFFQTRVLAAWREQQEQGWNLSRLWKATGALVSSMAATTAVLAALTFVIPAEEPAATQTASLLPSSAEAVMLEEEEELTNEQALSAIYDDETEAR
jgi:anti-sigma-K factor RskA